MYEKFIPRSVVRTIYDIDLLNLKEQGIRGIITDLDNTLVGAKVPNSTPELAEWLIQVRELGFQVVIVSNNNHERVQKFAEPLGVQFIHRAKKPTRSAFRQALHVMKLQADEVIMIGDQLLTDVLGGNRMGLHTILVNAISPNDEGFFTRINRRIEKRVLAKLHQSGRFPRTGGSS